LRSKTCEGNPDENKSSEDEVVTPAAKRKVVTHLVDTHGMSERRVCKAIGCSA
jgi:hypothetical protein